MDREDIHERLALGTRWDGCWALGKSEGGSSDEGVGAAGPTFLLAALVDPEVGDPLCAGENWTGSVPRHLVPLPVPEKIVPECSGSLLWPECETEMGEDSGSSLLNVGFIDEQGGNPVTCSQTGKSILLLSARKVKVRLVVASDPVVGHLQLLAGLHVEPGELVRSSVDCSDVVVLVLLQPGRL